MTPQRQKSPAAHIRARHDGKIVIYISESQEGREQKTFPRCDASHTAVKSILKTINATNHKIMYSYESKIKW